MASPPGVQRGAGLRTGHVTCPVTGRCAVATQWRWVTAWATVRGSLAPGRAAQLPRSTCWCLGRKGRRGAERQRGVVREGLPMPRHSACLQGVREPPGHHHLGEDGPVQRPGQGVAKGGSGLLREAGSGEGGPPESSGRRAGCGGGPGQEGTWPHGGPGFRSRGGGRPPEQRGQAALGIIRRCLEGCRIREGKRRQRRCQVSGLNKQNGITMYREGEDSGQKSGWVWDMLGLRGLMRRPGGHSKWRSWIRKPGVER